jgi:fructose-1,6-bisphosphatase I
MTGQLTLEDCLQRYSGSVPEGLDRDGRGRCHIQRGDRARRSHQHWTARGCVGLTIGRDSDGTLQRDLDVRADTIIRRSLGKLPIAALASEDMR